MQRTRFNGRQIILYVILPIILLGVLIALDQISKTYYKKAFDEKGQRTVIDGFFYLTYTFNSGSAYGFLSDKAWGQTFFKILTVVALLVFGVVLILSIKKKKVFLSYTIIFIIGGTVGNFIDRLLNNGVVDFLTLRIKDFVPFGVFNLADVFLSIGTVLLVVYLLFIDENALFKKNNGTEKNNNN